MSYYLTLTEQTEQTETIGDAIWRQSQNASPDNFICIRCRNYELNLRCAQNVFIAFVGANLSGCVYFQAGTNRGEVCTQMIHSEPCRTTIDYPCSEDTKRLNPDVFGKIGVSGTPTTPTKAPRMGKAHTVGENPSTGVGTVSEIDFQKQVIDYAHLKGWRVAHFRGAWSKDGKRYVTPVGADGKGFPDLVLVRKGELLFAELKSQNGKLSAEQETWRFALDTAALCVVRRPSDWSQIEKILK